MLEFIENKYLNPLTAELRFDAISDVRKAPCHGRHPQEFLEDSLSCAQTLAHTFEADDQHGRMRAKPVICFGSNGKVRVFIFLKNGRFSDARFANNHHTCWRRAFPEVGAQFVEILPYLGELRPEGEGSVHDASPRLWWGQRPFMIGLPQSSNSMRPGTFRAVCLTLGSIDRFFAVRRFGFVVLSDGEVDGDSKLGLLRCLGLVSVLSPAIA